MLPEHLPFKTLTLKHPTTNSSYRFRGFWVSEFQETWKLVKTSKNSDSILTFCWCTILASSLLLIDWESSRTFNTLSWYVIYHTAHLGTWRITIKTLHIRLSRSSQQLACIELFNRNYGSRHKAWGVKNSTRMVQGHLELQNQAGGQKKVQDVGVYILAIFPLHCSL